MILCDAPAGRGATWSEDGSIIAALDVVRGLALIPSVGGQPTSLTEVEPGESGHRTPYALPGGKAVLFTFSKVMATTKKPESPWCLSRIVTARRSSATRE
ncbi:MAG: hypothetical protein ABSF64_31740 [Bryobacteraceae bacterium]